MAVDTHSAINFNRYAYANNSPYRFIDPDGREACEGEACPILGKAQSTDAAGNHAAAGNADAERMSKSGKYSTVHMNQALSTITGDSGAGPQRPDVAGVLKDTGGVDTIEHPSKSQTPLSQELKGQGMQQKLAAIGKAGTHQTRSIATALKGIARKAPGPVGTAFAVGGAVVTVVRNPTQQGAATAGGDLMTGALCGLMGGCGEVQ